MPFTPAQEAAIHAHNRELLVSAAAGSGKTRVLIERIFSLLQNDELSIDRMLIVTFTHAAAAEMRERLQARLAQAATDDRRMRRQMELLETAQISTLHSFCQKIVREYFQEVDIDPQAMLGDQTVCGNLLKQAKDEAMDWLYEQAEAGEADLAALVAKFEDQQIVQKMDELYPFLMALPDPFGWMANVAGKHYTEQDLLQGELAETLLKDCRLLLNGMAELATESERLAEYPLMNEKYFSTIKSDRLAVDALVASAADGLPGLIAQARRFALDKLPGVRGLEGEEATLRDRYKECRDRIKKLNAAVVAHLPEEPTVAIEHMNAMQPALCGLSKLMQEMDSHYAALKRERTLMDFTDLERMALRILHNPAIREEVSARFDGVFVDEYQDISAVQEAILNAVKQNVPRETSGMPQRYFYVGDVKQSIYRFRQADPTLFMDKARSFSPEENADCRRISLNANFRSRETVLAGVNRVFQRVMRADVTEIDYDDEARLYAGQPSTQDPPTSLHLFTQGVKAGEKARLQAYAIGQEIRRRVGEPVLDCEGKVTGTLHYRDIAILGPKMKDVANVLERTLGEMGIPVYSEDHGSGMASEEIAQAMNHLKLMDNIADDLALLTSLRSPAIGLDERELAAVRLRYPQGSYLEAVRAVSAQTDLLAKRCLGALGTLEHERFLLRETPLDEYLWGWLSRSGMYAFYGCQSSGKLRQANLRMLCEKAGEHVKRRGGDLKDFLNSVEAQTGVRDSSSPTVLSPWEDVVRVMTIHKSKGLEFPVVFVMGLEEAFSARRGSSLAMHPRLGVALPYVNEQARTTGDTLLKAAIDLRRQAEEKAERARLLYVAMTRARDELILMGCGNQLAPEDAPAGFPQNRGNSAYAVFSAGSMLGWVCGCADDTDAVEVWEAEEVSDIPMRTTASKTAFSTQSTFNPQKTGGWRLVFHTGEAELKTALRYARGKKELSELELRRARLQSLAEDARALAARQAREAAGTASVTGGEDPARQNGENPASAQASIYGASQTDAQAVNRETTEATESASGRFYRSERHGQMEYGGSPVRELSPAPDPVAPPLHFSHHPFKVGVTALVRAEKEAHLASAPLFDPEEGDPAAVESVDQKRLPLPLARPRLMNDLPTLPAFLRAPAEETGLRRGVATHKALSLLKYDGLRGLCDNPLALRVEIANQLDAFGARRLLEGEERRLTDAETIARFLESPVGREALLADTVHREWSFNLRLAERDGLIVQGVIDLCYLNGGQWSLVDYKTDRVANPQELWELYGAQIALYRRALVEGTGLPVREATLFSLSLGVGASRT